MNRQKIAQELVRLARELTAKDPIEVAHDYIMTYPGRLKAFRDAVSGLEDALADTKKREEALVRAGAGRTEAQTILGEPLRKAQYLQKLVDNLVQGMEKVKRG